MQIANANNDSIKRCAFCRNWYDPTNSAIVPKAPNIGLWEYEPNQKSKCMVQNSERFAAQTCNKFILKI